MNRRLFMLIVMVFLPLSVYAQTAGQSSTQAECTLTMDKSPTIRGLKLGMSAEQLLALFPGSSQPNLNAKIALEKAQGYPNYGEASVNFYASAGSTVFNDRFVGIDAINTTLFDGQVVGLMIYYAGPDSNPRGPTWMKVDDFIAKVKGAFSLPEAKDWLYASETSKMLKCRGFEIHATTSGGRAAISLRGKPYADIVRERAAADEEQKRREFKP